MLPAEQFMLPPLPVASNARMRRLVTVFDIDGTTSPPETTRLRSSHHVRIGSCAARRPTRPVTCGVAIDVPLIVWYEPIAVGYVLRIAEPGAPMCTLWRPK